ncbi:hypothetical protein Y032_0012g1608 [Ancylostoma ceylanicum]|uniref:Uncharacterized protein n=1 Tax=Ancylostoma ceylanicum TaxID=53326 RepID=A0A016VC11_9BILA|nr:hypothetical protein Y032_0012g1608 [Ancylostoma ceylanicum]
MWPLRVAVKDWPNGITFSTTQRNFTKTRILYKMNTVFVFSISNNPYMRNLREFCEIPCLLWPCKKKNNEGTCCGRIWPAKGGWPRPRRNSASCLFVAGTSLKAVSFLVLRVGDDS